LIKPHFTHRPWKSFPQFTDSSDFALSGFLPSELCNPKATRKAAFESRDTSRFGCSLRHFQGRSFNENGDMNEHATPFTDLKPLALISADLGVSRTTVWRWKQRGWLRTITIAGKRYVKPTSEATKDESRMERRRHQFNFF
jgi:hypothetical protein